MVSILLYYMQLWHNTRLHIMTDSLCNICLHLFNLTDLPNFGDNNYALTLNKTKQAAVNQMSSKMIKKLANRLRSKSEGIKIQS